MTGKVLVFAVLVGIVSCVALPAFSAEEKTSTGVVATPAALPPPAPPAKFDVEGAPIPAIPINTLADGKEVNLSKLGKPALILFINSACSACRAEVSSLSGLATKYKDKLASYIVTVDFDPKNTPSRFPDLAKTDYILLDGSNFELAKALGFTFTPATLVLDATGKQVLRKGGFASGDEVVVVKTVMGLMK